MKRDSHIRPAELLDQKPPSDTAAELMVLRAIVLEGTIMDAANLTADHFYEDAHRRIYAAIAGLRENCQPIDIAHLVGELKAEGQLDAVGGAPKLADMLSGERIPAHTASYIRAVKDCYAKRQILNSAIAMIQAVRTSNVAAVDIVEQGFKRLHMAKAEADGTRQCGTRAVAVPFSKIESKALEFLWPARFPLGKLSLIVGDSGDGKSLLACDLAARITRGRLWPSGTGRAPQGKVLICSCEDDPEDTIRPRLLAAGADDDSARLFQKRIVDERTRKETPAALNLATDIPLVDQELAAGGYKALILDTITGFMGRVDNNSATDVRNVLTPLVDLAARHGVAIIGLSHLTKNDSTAARYRTNGSVAYNAVARSVLAVGRDPADKDLRLLAGVKTNLGPAPSTLGYRIRVKEIEQQAVPYIEWLDEPVQVDADEMLAPAKSPAAGARDAAAEWLQAYLADGPRLKGELSVDSANAGIAEKTLDRAKQQLGVVSRKRGMGGPWLWCLPNHVDLADDWPSSATLGKRGGNGDPLRSWSPGVVGTFEVGQGTFKDGQTAPKNGHPDV